MSTFSSNIGPEEEDGAGWGGLVETREEREAAKLLTKALNEKAMMQASILTVLEMLEPQCHVMNPSLMAVRQAVRELRRHKPIY